MSRAGKLRKPRRETSAGPGWRGRWAWIAAGVIVVLLLAGGVA